MRLLNLDDVAVNPANVSLIVQPADHDHPTIQMTNGQTIQTPGKSYTELVVLMNEAMRG